MTPREPDRFDAKARELVWGPGPASRTWNDFAAHIAAALRAEHASALERAAQAVDLCCNRCGERIRALIPPAAAPAAETRKAQGAEPPLSKANAPNSLPGVVGAYPEQAVRFMEAQEALLRECDEALREWPGFSKRRALRAKLAARAAPPEREGE